MFFNSGGFIMLKDEWLEYFEAVNGRKPRPIDFKEALERGEFVLSEGTEANQVADQGESAADQQFEEGTATARALAQSQTRKKLWQMRPRKRERPYLKRLLVK